MIEIKVLFFGALKQYFPPELTLQMEDNVTPATLKGHVAAALSESSPAALALLEECAIATEAEILREKTYAIPSGSRVALLPPVCGG